MSVIEIKREIYQIVEQNEDEVLLARILELLNTPHKKVKEIDATKHIEQLFAENDGLLKRLA